MGYFIENLRRTIDKTEVYQPTGKYGKPELDSRATADEKLEKFLLAEPITAEDIDDYVLFAASLNALKNRKVYKKIKTLVTYSKYSEKDISVALKIFKEYERKKILALIIGILLSLGLPIAWWVFFIQNWGVFWQVLWFFYGPLICLTPIYFIYLIPFMVFGDDNPFDN